MEALKTRNAKGQERKLSGQQLSKLYRIITAKNLLQLKFEFALWIRVMIREVMRAEFNDTFSEVSVVRLLHKLGLSP